jgi:peroxiredoxin
MVLCYLEGLTAEAAAKELGCPRGTVLSRLSQARKRLRGRLARRGLGLPAGMVAVGGGSSVSEAALPAGFVETLINSTVASVARQTTTTSPAVAALAEGVLTMMTRTRLIRVVAAAAVVGLATVGAGLLVRRAALAAGQNVSPSKAANTGAVPAETVNAGEIVVRAADMSGPPERSDEAFMGVAAINPATGAWRTVYKGLSFGPISPDGRFMLYSRNGGNLDKSEDGVWVHDFKGQVQARRIFLRRGHPLWSHSGQKVVIAVSENQTPEKWETWRLNADGTDPVRLPIHQNELVLDCSRDGDWLLTRSQGGDPNHRGRLTLIRPDGTGARTLTEGSPEENFLTIFKISPDGKRVAYAEHRPEGNVSKARLLVLDIDGQHRRQLPVVFEPDAIATMDWSPDGSQLVLNSMSRSKPKILSSLAVVNADGTNYRALSLPAGEWNLQLCGWQTLTSGLRVPAKGDLERSPETRKVGSPRSRYYAIIEEYKTALRPYTDELPRAKSREERIRIAREKYVPPQKFFRRFLDLAESAPDDPASADALVWIIQRGFAGPDLDRAIDLLAEHHAASTMVGHASMTLSHSISPEAEPLFRAIMEHNDSRNIKGLACLSLGRYLKNLSETVRSLREDPVEANEWKMMMIESGAEEKAFESLAAREPDALLKQAEETLEQAVRDYGDTSGQSGRLADDAQKDLHEIRNLALGKPTPEIKGQDLEGRDLKLGDFRGKVVCLLFWTKTCTTCQDVVAYEHSLTNSLRNEPFALVGVNFGDDRGLLRKEVNDAGITFRSFWDSGGSLNAPGPIASQFNVHGCPSFYIFDHRGIIRHKFLGSVSKERLRSVIQALVDAARKDQPQGHRQTH